MSQAVSVPASSVVARRDIASLERGPMLRAQMSGGTHRNLAANIKAIITRMNADRRLYFSVRLTTLRLSCGATRRRAGQTPWRKGSCIALILTPPTAADSS